MAHDLIDAMVNGIAVLVGLFVLWSFVGGMKNVDASIRLKFAAFAGAVSAIVTFAFASLV